MDHRVEPGDDQSCVREIRLAKLVPQVPWQCPWISPYAIGRDWPATRPMTAVSSPGCGPPASIAASLPGAPGTHGQCRLLPVGGSGRSGRFPALPALPSGNRAILSGVEGLAQHRRARFAADRGRRARRGGEFGRGRRRGSGSAPASWRGSSPSTSRRAPRRSGPRPFGATRQALHRHHRFRGGGDRAQSRLHQPAPLQHRVRRNLRPPALRDPPASLSTSGSRSAGWR